MEQTPDKRAHLVTALFDSLADSPELLGDVKDSMVATVLKKLRENDKVLKHENVLRKQENQNTWNTATQTFDSVIDRVVKNTTDIEDLKRKVEMLYGNVGDTSIDTAAVDGDRDGVNREASVDSSASSASSNKSMRND